MISDQQVADILWLVRLMRVEGVTQEELNAQTVYERQQYTRYGPEAVRAILSEIERRGYRWSTFYPGCSRACILVGESQHRDALARAAGLDWQGKN